MKKHCRVSISAWVALACVLAGGRGWPTMIAADPRTEGSQQRSRFVTRDQVQAVLDPDEPDYASAARLGPGALPHLEELIAGPDTNLASKAVYMASLIRDRRAAAVVLTGSTSSRVEVRIATAAAARNLPRTPASDILTGLLGDNDSGVRTVALKAIKTVMAGGTLPASVRERLIGLAADDPQPHIRGLARELLGPSR